MKEKFIYYLVLSFIFSSIVIADEEYTIYYNFDQGPNLVSFPINSESDEIELFFTSENANLIINNPIANEIISVITEGAFTFQSGDNWNGSLESINSEQGYWVVADEPFYFLFTGTSINQNLFFLHPGANLISYPFNTQQYASESINFLPDDMVYAILGQNEALLSVNGSWWGSLERFIPGKGYWFIVNDYTPFQYSDPQENNNFSNPKIITEERDEETEYIQSILQSVFFIESIYFSGNENTNDLILQITCNDVVVGQKIWDSEFSDIVAMGSDGFEQTENYCEQNQEVKFKYENSEQEFYLLKGNNYWQANSFSVNILSDSQFGDLNYNDYLNITDLIIMLEHILEINIFTNNHQILLSDINQDSLINIADLIINLENILAN